MKKVLVHRIRVRNDELDGFGHVNHAVYLHYLEDARWAALEEWGFSFDELQRRSWTIVATEVRLSYRAPACGREVLEVHTTFGPTSRVRSLWKQRIRRPGNGQLLLDAEIEGVFLGRNGRAMRIPEELRHWFSLYAEEG